MPPTLDYQPPPTTPPRPNSPRVAAALATALSAELLSIAFLISLMDGGPIFPFTAVYAPIAMANELVPATPASFVVYLFFAGRLLLAIYAYLATRYPRPLVWIALASFHLACFAIVSHLRAVIWPWN